jgi:hypothetical protein
MSESRCTHSAVSSALSDGGEAVLAGGGAEAAGAVEKDPADEGVAEDGAADDDAADVVVGVVPLGGAGGEPFVLVGLSGGGSGGGLAVCADATTGTRAPARAPNVRKKRE